MKDEGFFDTLLGDGRALFKLVALGLIGAGIFVVFQAATGHFLIRASLPDITIT